LHQQQQAAGLLLAAVALQPDVGAEDGLDAFLARLAVELHRAEQVRQIADRQRALPVLGRRGHHVVHPQGAIDDGELGVAAQVDEVHARHSREAASWDAGRAREVDLSQAERQGPSGPPAAPHRRAAGDPLGPC